MTHSDVTYLIPNVITNVTNIPNVIKNVTNIIGSSEVTTAISNVITDVSNATDVSIFPSSLRTECVELSATKLLPCDHAESLVSRATRRRVEEVVYVGLLPLLVVVGVVGNVFNLAVFVAQGLKDRVNLCLFCLSIADLLGLVSLYVRRMDKTLAYVISPSWAYDVWVTSLIRYRLVAVYTGFLGVSNFISIVIAVDRCVCVTWPLHAARALSTRMTGVVIIVFSILVFAGMQFVAFKYDVRCAVITGKTSASFLLILPSDLYKDNPALMDVLDSFVFSSLVPTVSLLITATATTITAVKLRRAAVWRDRAMGGGGTDVINRKEKNLTYTLVVISCMYIACVSPRVVKSLCRYFIPEFRVWGRQCNLVLLMEALVNVLLAVNSAVNFFVYCTMGSRFRCTLRRVLVCASRRSLKKLTVTDSCREISDQF